MEGGRKTAQTENCGNFRVSAHICLICVCASMYAYEYLCMYRYVYVCLYETVYVYVYLFVFQHKCACG